MDDCRAAMIFQYGKVEGLKDSRTVQDTFRFFPSVVEVFGKIQMIGPRVAIGVCRVVN